MWFRWRKKQQADPVPEECDCNWAPPDKVEEVIGICLRRAGGYMELGLFFRHDRYLRSQWHEAPMPGLLALHARLRVLCMRFGLQEYYYDRYIVLRSTRRDTKFYTSPLHYLDFRRRCVDIVARYYGWSELPPEVEICEKCFATFNQVCGNYWRPAL